MTATHMPGLLHPPSGDMTPVELAVVGSIMDGFEPETYLGVVFYRPDGGCRMWHAWTDGADVLGDQVDGHALALGLDAADWLHIGDRHSTVSNRGRVRVEAYPLRPVLADVGNGVRSPEERRTGLRRVIDCAAAQTGQIPRPGLPGWPGFGPTLLHRKAR
ncbi:hypothetical protein ABZ499_33080 [Streptomyces sp. NPDC019990]|uniref:hypothetical protein n=1 Tax=Streptomyces sp. NPDC019990 TaxID=3154693 RepID=UPI0033D4356D